jgi:hypothetical protein
MPSEKEKDAAALIAEAKHWIRNTRRFASNIEDQQAKAAIGKIYNILAFHNQALGKMLKGQVAH